MSVEKIISTWKKKDFKPVYWLEGEEDFYINKIVDYAEHELLSAEEASFNLTIFYGKDADWSAVLNTCKSYPMFADKQIVLLKEAQQMKDIEKLETYISAPLASTDFIVAYKAKGLDKRKTLHKTVAKNAVV
ncbi:MAG: DNA polymerase III subunit delta, partial [Ferruginibacter sp.]